MEVKHQAAQALRSSACLNDTIWNNKHLRKEAKVRIYKSVVRPILTYAAETRPETAKTTQILEAAEMRTLRRISNLSLFDREKSEDVREACGIQKILQWIRRRKEWYAHVGNMSGDRILCKIMKNRPKGNGVEVVPRKDGTTIWYKQTLRFIKEEEEEDK